MSVQTTPAQNRNALSDLLSHYVVGNLPDATFSSVCDLMEEALASADERLAFAGFYLDALSAGETDLALPKPEEIMDVIQIARA
jgi:hypothetical protein